MILTKIIIEQSINYQKNFDTIELAENYIPVKGVKLILEIIISDEKPLNPLTSMRYDMQRL